MTKWNRARFKISASKISPNCVVILLPLSPLKPIFSIYPIYFVIAQDCDFD